MLRFFFDGGPITYRSAADTAQDLKTRGISVKLEKPADEFGIPEKMRRTWQRAGTTPSRQRTDTDLT